MFSLKPQTQEQIARTGFYTSLLSYVFFWSLDLWRPGFVARFFSVHIFLLGMILFGVWWGMVVEEYTESLKIQQGISFVCGIFLCMLTWNLGSEFGVWRLFVSAFSLILPSVIHRLLHFK